MTLCDSCRAPIVWAVTKNGKRIPVDREPHPDGNLILDHTGPSILATYARKDEASQERYRSHFATCPNAGSHRRR